jgi:hypothetical protein
VTRLGRLVVIATTSALLLAASPIHAEDQPAKSDASCYRYRGKSLPVGGVDLNGAGDGKPIVCCQPPGSGLPHWYAARTDCAGDLTAAATWPDISVVLNITAASANRDERTGEPIVSDQARWFICKSLGCFDLHLRW